MRLSLVIKQQLQAVKHNPRLVYLGEGRTRVVYRILTPKGKPSGYVLKLPINEWGVKVNEDEALLAKSDIILNQDQKARCRLFRINLVMEEVRLPSSDREWDSLPLWTNFVDCQQVGFNRQGKVVAFDYGE